MPFLLSAAAKTDMEPAADAGGLHFQLSGPLSGLAEIQFIVAAVVGVCGLLLYIWSNRLGLLLAKGLE